MPPNLTTLRPNQILVFSHNCSPQSKFFCFRLPPVCPTCLERISTPIVHNSVDSGFQVRHLPCPLKSADSASCALAIRPSNGHFLFDYENESDLHICLISSDGRVVEYDQQGARMVPPPQAENTGIPIDRWTSCLIIKIFNERPSWQMASLWDQRLEQFIGSDRWTAEAYNAQTNNCFDFVLEFLRSLNLDHLKSSIVSKTVFCEHLIVPNTKILGRYISLFRKVTAEKIVNLSSLESAHANR